MIIFAGFDITSYSVKPCKKYLDKIPHFPATNNITNMYSWFKLINKVLYSFAANKSILPFREAVKLGTLFFWNDELNQNINI